MKISSLQFLPKARWEGIVSKKVEGELLVYDRTRDKAHCLNESAAAIWKRCDGQISPTEIAVSLGKEYGVAVDERVVWLGLAELRRSHLLEEPADLDQTSNRNKTQWPPNLTGMAMSRREAVRRIGLGAAIALPIVVSITAPTPAQAGTCKHNNSSCTAPAECCSGVCTGSPKKCLGG
jgi:Coenzyme PQQ synthesis protein D (PqqD)